LITPGQSKSKAQWRFFRVCDFSSEEVRFGLRTAACHGDYEAVNRPRCAAENRRYSWNRRSYFGSLFRLNLGVQIGQLAALSSDLTQLMMFQGSCRRTRTPEVSRPPIPHRPRGGHARHEALAWSQAEGIFHPSWHAQMGMWVGMDPALHLGPRQRFMMCMHTATRLCCS
jgi:hypothetical protein